MQRLKTEFEKIYIAQYSKLKRFAKEYVLSDEDAENIVQDVFLEAWENWETLSTHHNLAAYFFLTLKNKCLDSLRRRVVLRKIESALTKEHELSLRLNYEALDAFNHQLFSQQEIEEVLQKAIRSLPDKCREIFIKSKIEGKKNKDIAKELDISINTIESQMGIAYKKLRKELKHFAPLFLFLFLH